MSDKLSSQIQGLKRAAAANRAKSSLAGETPIASTSGLAISSKSKSNRVMGQAQHLANSGLKISKDANLPEQIVVAISNERGSKTVQRGGGRSKRDTSRPKVRVANAVNPTQAADYNYDNRQ